jgi:hypothetical protein
MSADQKHNDHSEHARVAARHLKNVQVIQGMADQGHVNVNETWYSAEFPALVYTSGNICWSDTSAKPSPGMDTIEAEWHALPPHIHLDLTVISNPNSSSFSTCRSLYIVSWKPHVYDRMEVNQIQQWLELNRVPNPSNTIWEDTIRRNKILFYMLQLALHDHLLSPLVNVIFEYYHVPAVTRLEATAWQQGEWSKLPRQIPLVRVEADPHWKELNEKANNGLTHQNQKKRSSEFTPAAPAPPGGISAVVSEDLKACGKECVELRERFSELNDLFRAQAQSFESYVDTHHVEVKQLRDALSTLQKDRDVICESFVQSQRGVSEFTRVVDGLIRSKNDDKKQIDKLKEKLHEANVLNQQLRRQLQEQTVHDPSTPSSDQKMDVTDRRAHKSSLRMLTH